MPFDLPQTPQSPSYTPGATDSSSKATVSPRINTSLPTPAHSVNGSMSSLNSAVEASQSDDLSNKRKRGVEDHGDRDQKKVHVEDSRLSINDLHQEVGQKYLLCRTRKNPFFLADLIVSHLRLQIQYTCRAYYTSFIELFG